MTEQTPVVVDILALLSDRKARTRRQIREATGRAAASIALALEFLLVHNIISSNVCRMGIRGAPPTEYSLDPATRRIWAQEAVFRAEQARNALKPSAS
jgi:hypothetical protein